MPKHSPPSFVTFKHYHSAADGCYNDRPQKSPAVTLPMVTFVRKTENSLFTACRLAQNVSTIGPSQSFFQIFSTNGACLFVSRARGCEKTLLFTPYEISGLGEQAGKFL